MERDKVVLSRKVKGESRQRGLTTGGERLCMLEGCGGMRYGVRWPNGELRWLCSKSLATNPKGELYLV